MSCPTCSCTMQMLSTDKTHFWCPRCGTLLEGGEHVAPKVIPKLREFEETFLANLDHVIQEAGDPMRMAAHVQLKWISLGVAESLRPEGERYGDDRARQKERAKRQVVHYWDTTTDNTSCGEDARVAGVAYSIYASEVTCRVCLRALTSKIGQRTT